jgi:long-chain acyl-CoA synthetase
MGLNIAVMLRESARTCPEKVVAISAAGAMTYAELDAASDRFATGLAARGLVPGDSVCIQLPNVPQFLVSYFGTLKAGCVVVPLNPMYKAGEVAHVLRDSGTRLLLTWVGSVEHAAKAAADVGLGEVFVLGMPGTPVPLGRPFADLLGLAPDGPAPLHPTEPGDVAVIVYTSGTTGQPKGAELTHFQLLMNADTPGRLFGIRDDDVVLAVLPLFHVFGLASILNVCVRFAATMTLVPRFEAGTVLEVIQRDRVTIFEGVPTMYVALLNHPDMDGYDLSSIRIGISGGAPIPAEVLDEFERRLGVVILEGYGMSETAATATFNPSARERRVYSVGKPIWGVEVQIWDGSGTLLPRGRDHVGELVIRGVNVMRGYHGQPAATAAAFDRGWLRTGDLGYADEDGFIFIVDRKKDLIIRGGYNVYPREVEDVLYSHPAIAEAAVIGVPDPWLGQEIKAVVALRAGREATEAELVEYVRERLASYKYPRSVEFRAELPKNAANKIVKRDL